MAVKRVNRKRIELTRKVLFELKHVSEAARQWPRRGPRDTGGGGTPGCLKKGMGPAYCAKREGPRGEKRLVEEA